MKKFLFCIIAALVSVSLYAQEFENEEGEKNSRVRETEEQRRKMLEISAGSRNLALLNYRAVEQVKRTTQTEGYTNFNGSWQQVALPNSPWGMGRINCFTVDPVNGNTIYAGTPTGGLWRTNNNGANWQCLTNSLPVTGVSGVCVDPNNTNIIYILTGTASTVEGQSLGVFKSYDGGSNWYATGLDSSYVYNWFYNSNFNANKLIMDPSNSNVLLAAMTSGLYRTEDGGGSWTRVISDVDVRDVAFKPNNSNIVYVTTAYKTARCSKDNGRTFTSDLNVLKPQHLTYYASLTLAVTPAAPDSVFFAGTSDDGNADSDTAYIVHGWYNSVNNNFSFSKTLKCLITFPVNGYPAHVANALRWNRDIRLAISPSTTAVMYANGLWTYATNNYGGSWFNKMLDNGNQVIIHSDATQISFINNYVYASNDGGIYRQPINTAPTTAWEILTGTMPISQIFRIGASQTSTSKFSLALQDNGTHELNTSTNTYKLLSVGDGVMARMNPLNANTYYEMVNDYRIIRTVNNTRTDITPDPSLGYNFLPFEADQADSNRIYAAYKNLYISSNQGNNWSTITTGSTRNTRVMGISKSNNQVIWLLEEEVLGNNTVITPAVLRRTTNGGANFNVISLPSGIPVSYISDIVVSPVDANRVYLTIDGYFSSAKVFVTTNGLAAPGSIVWTDLQSSSLPNVPVTCLAYESAVDHSIYIGTEIGMFYFSATLNKWISYNNGMPVCRVSDLYINKNSLKIIAATYGRGIFISDLYGYCTNNIALSGTQSGIYTYSAGTDLSSTAQLTGAEATRIQYFGGTTVTLNPGFSAPAGSTFVAGIAPCGGSVDPIVTRPAAANSSASGTRKKHPPVKPVKKPTATKPTLIKPVVKPAVSSSSKVKQPATE